MPLTNEEYQDAQNQLTMLAGAIVATDVEGLLESAEKADAIAPLVDPTLWMRGRDRLDAIKELARGAVRFKQAALVFRNTMMRIGADEEARSNRGR